MRTQEASPNFPVKRKNKAYKRRLNHKKSAAKAPLHTKGKVFNKNYTRYPNLLNNHLRRYLLLEQTALRRNFPRTKQFLYI